MKKHLVYLLLALTTCWTQAQDSTKVLFIGNSITYFNNMPFTFEAIATSLGDTTDVTMYAPGGTGFLNHIGDANVYNHFRQGNWDYVILQPGSGDSGGAPVGGTPVNISVQRIRMLLDSIYTYSPCAKVLFYEISNGVTGNSAAALANYNAIMNLIRSNVEYFADSTGLGFAPVGEALRTAWNNDSNNLLWGSYGDIHPNAKGSYIAACVFYASIFQKASLGTTVLNALPAAEAAAYQQLADTIVLQQLSNWRIGTYDQSTDFNYVVNAQTVTFNNMSEHIDSVVWTFGDATRSTNLNPIHTYTTAGNYPVQLTSYKNGCAQTVEKTVPIGTLTTQQLSEQIKWRIYPNPVGQFLYIEHEDKDGVYEVELYNSMGQLIKQSTQLTINVSAWSKGMYSIKLTNLKTSESSIKKWLKS